MTRPKAAKSKLKMVISPRQRWISEIQRWRGLMTVFRNFALRSTELK